MMAVLLPTAALAVLACALITSIADGYFARLDAQVRAEALRRRARSR